MCPCAALTAVGALRAATRAGSRTSGSPQGRAAAAGSRDRRADDFTLADELAGEASRAAVPGCGASQDQRIAAVLDDGLRFAVAIGIRDLGDGPETEHTAAAELARSGEGVLQTVAGAEGVEFVDHEPESLAALAFRHGLEDREAQAGGNAGCYSPVDNSRIARNEVTQG